MAGKEGIIPISFITHRDKQILYVDYRGMKTNVQMIDTMRRLGEMVTLAPGKLLLLYDYRDAVVSSEFMAAAKQLTSELKPLHKVEKRAAVGIMGIKKILLQAYNVFSGDEVRPFNTLDEAKDHLTA